MTRFAKHKLMPSNLVRRILAAALAAIAAGSALAAPGDDWTWRNPLSSLGTGSTGIKRAIVTDAGPVLVGRHGLIMVNGVRRESGTTATLLTVAASGPDLVAAGENSTIVTSSDSGATWTLRQTAAPGTGISISNVARGNGRWVACGAGGLLTSPTGVTWNTVPVPGFPAPIYSTLVWNGSHFLVGGFTSILTFDSGMARSADGITWTAIAGAPAWLRSLMWTGSRWVAVGDGVFTSPDGLVWTGPAELSDVVSGFREGGLCVLVAMGQGEDPNSEAGFYTSADGLTWVRRNDVATPAAGHIWNSMTVHEQTFVIAGETGSLLSSTDGGVTWTSSTTGFPQLNTVFHSGGHFHAMGGDGHYLRSPDGVTWEPMARGIRSRLRAITFHNGLWVAGGREEPEFGAPPARTFSLMTSSDGFVWTDRSFDLPGFFESPQIYSVIRAGNQWVAAAAEFVLTSPDAVTWTAIGAGSENRALAWNGSALLMAGGIEDEENGSTSSILRSTDGGTSWQFSYWNTKFLRAAVWTGTQFIVAGDEGHLVTSPTGAAGTWISRTTGTLLDLRGLAWDPIAGAVAVGGNFSTGPVILTSPDGATWTPRTAPGNQLFYSVTRAGNVWLATGYDGAAATSPDGITWTSRPAPTSHELYAGAWNGIEFLAAGEAGAILSTGRPPVPPEWVSISAGHASGSRLEWESVPGLPYHIESTPDLSAPWSPLPGSPVWAAGPRTVFTFNLPDPEPRRLFFRVRQ